jgi:hypothetical protein
LYDVPDNTFESDESDGEDDDDVDGNFFLDFIYFSVKLFPRFVGTDFYFSYSIVLGYVFNSLLKRKGSQATFVMD